MHHPQAAITILQRLFCRGQYGAWLAASKNRGKSQVCQFCQFCHVHATRPRLQQSLLTCLHTSTTCHQVSALGTCLGWVSTGRSPVLLCTVETPRSPAGVCEQT